jgi:hypothetical protein
VPEPTAQSIGTLRTGLEDLAAASRALTERPEDEDEEAALLRAGIGVIRRFYTAFFAELYDAEVDGFGWEPKRRAVEAILLKEQEDEDEDTVYVVDLRGAVASLYEDFSDVLHGDVDFGYTDDVELLRSFANDYLDLWWDSVYDWLDAADAPDARALKRPHIWER